MSALYDIAILGAGPAGSTAAITASRAGFSTLLLERDTFPRAKVCGEFVSAESLAVLGRLIGPGHALLQETPVISAGRLFFREVVYTAIAPAARSIPRWELDHALWRAAIAGGVCAHAGEAVTPVESHGDGPVRIRTAAGEYSARCVVNASGRWSGLFQPLTTPASPKWIGLKAHFATAAREPTVDLYFFKHGYCGVQPVREGVVNACAMVRSDAATTLDEVFRSHSALAERVQAWRAQTPVVATAPLVHARPQPVRGEVLQIGDAAGFIDPFLGDGISLALQTGVWAVRALQPFLEGAASRAAGARTYAAGYRERFLPAFHHAARLRRVLALTQPFQPAVSGLLKLPHLTEWLLQKTRPRAVGFD